jgi:hypothetical protein
MNGCWEVRVICGIADPRKLSGVREGNISQVETHMFHHDCGDTWFFFDSWSVDIDGGDGHEDVLRAMGEWFFYLPVSIRFLYAEVIADFGASLEDE